METLIQINTKYIFPSNFYELIPEREELEKIADLPKSKPIANKRIIRMDTFPDDEINLVRRNSPYWILDYFDDDFLGDRQCKPNKRENPVRELKRSNAKVCLRTAGVNIEEFYKIVPPKEHLDKLENLPPLFESSNGRLIYIMGYPTGKESWEEIGTYEIVDFFDSEKAGTEHHRNLREEIIHINVNEIMGMH